MPNENEPNPAFETPDYRIASTTRLRRKLAATAMGNSVLARFISVLPRFSYFKVNPRPLAVRPWKVLPVRGGVKCDTLSLSWGPRFAALNPYAARVFFPDKTGDNLSKMASFDPVLP